MCIKNSEGFFEVSFDSNKGKQEFEFEQKYITSSSTMFDKLDSIMSDQKNFDNEMNEQYKDQPFSCYNFTKENFDIWYPLMRAQCEINESSNLIPSKTWKNSDKPLDKQKLLEEIIDAQKFLNKAIISLGFTAKDVYDMHVKKSQINRQRQKEGY